jgi:hypothetical protein
MKLISNEYRRNYPFDPALNFGFEDLKLKLDFTLVISLTDPTAIQRISGKKVYFDLEEPNKFFVSKGWHNSKGDDFDHYLTIDPFSNDFFSQRSNRIGNSVYIPTDPKKVPNFSPQREYDVVYSGHIVSKSLAKLLERVRERFRLAVVSGSNHPLVTHRNLDYNQKLELVANSKVSLVHNVLWPRFSHVQNVKNRFDDWKSHGAFEDFRQILPWGMTVPQLKSRLFESAFCGTVPVVFLDDWNLASNYFPSSVLKYARNSNLLDVIEDTIAMDRRRVGIAQDLREYAFDNYTTRNFAKDFLSAI